MNPIQTHFGESDFGEDTRKLFNQAVEQLAITSDRPFSEVYRDLESALNALCQYVIQEEP